MKNEYMRKRQRYYFTKTVQYELLNAMRNREVVFMDRKENWKCVRGLWIKSIEYLNKFFKHFDFFNRDYNIYISVAQYRHIPPFTLNLSERSQETANWFKKNALKQLYHYNYLYDFDSRYRDSVSKKWIIDRPRMLQEIIKLKNFIKEMDRYYIIPSGTNFQLVTMNTENVHYKIIKKEIYNAKKMFDLRHLDLAGAGHPFKLMKCPYSMAGENVCFPLEYHTEKELKDYKQYDSNVLLRTANFFQRGLKIK